MEKVKLLRELESKLKKFQVWDRRAFNELLDLQPEDFQSENDVAYLITDLLEALCNYEKVDLLTEEEIKKIIHECASINNRNVIADLDNIFEISRLSYEYLQIIEEENWIHPAISIYNDEKILSDLNRKLFDEFDLIREQSVYPDLNKQLDLLLDEDMKYINQNTSNHFNDIILPNICESLIEGDVESALNRIIEYYDYCWGLSTDSAQFSSIISSEIIRLLNEQKENDYSDMDPYFASTIDNIEECYLTIKSYQYKYHKDIWTLDIYKENRQKM